MNENRPIDNVREVIYDFERGRLSRRSFIMKSLAIGLSLPAAIALLEACSTTPAASSAAGSSSAAPGQGNVLKAALVTPQKAGDLGPVDSMIDGLKKGVSELNYETKVVEVVQGEYTEAVRSLAADKYDLVFGAFPPMIDAITEVAAQYPNQHFSLIIGATEATIPNVTSLWELGLEGCFLVAALGGLYTKSGTTGGVIAQRNPEQDRFIAGYQQGLAATNTNAKFLFNVVAGQNPFEDPATGKRLALLLHEQGADVVHGSGGKTIQGVHEAAAASNKGFVSTGMDRDQCIERPDSTLCSIRIYEGSMVFGVMESLRNDKWKPGNFLPGIVDGGEDLCTFDDSKPEGQAEPLTGHKIGPGLPQEVRDMVWNLRSQIRSGQLKVSDKVKE